MSKIKIQQIDHVELFVPVAMTLPAGIKRS